MDAVDSTSDDKIHCIIAGEGQTRNMYKYKYHRVNGIVLHSLIFANYDSRGD